MLFDNHLSDTQKERKDCIDYCMKVDYGTVVQIAYAPLIGPVDRQHLPRDWYCSGVNMWVTYWVDRVGTHLLEAANASYYSTPG